MTPETPTAPSRATAANPARARLTQLQGYLEVDPANEPLLADTFDAALRAHDWPVATDLLRRGQAQGSQVLAWALREADCWLAQGRLPEARATLLALQERPDAPAAFAHAVTQNLAYVAFREGDYTACVATLAARVEPPAAGQDTQAQRLWLQALHRTRELPRALAWVHQLEAQGALTPGVAGVASLIAVDQSDLHSAERWARAALAARAQTPEAPMEALVALATVLLARRNAPQAQQLAHEALALRRDDGRAWSVLAFASLLAGNLGPARDQFAQALRHMPAHIGTWHGQGWAQLLLGELDAAHDSFAAALALDRNFAESHGGLAVVAALQNHTEAARAHIERANRLDRHNLAGRYAQAILAGETQDRQAVQRLARRLLEGRNAPLGGTLLDAVMPDGGPGGAGEAWSSKT